MGSIRRLKPSPAMAVALLVLFIPGLALAGGGFDNNFSEDGVLVSDLGGSEDLSAVTLGSQGRVVVAGESDADGGQDDFAVSVYRRNGKPDRGFSNDGHRLVGYGNEDSARDVDIRGGRIVVVGRADEGAGTDEAAVATLRAVNGQLNDSFSGDGRMLLGLGFDAEGIGVEILSNGKALIAVRDVSLGTGDFYLVQLKRNGDFDSKFGGGDGIVETDFGGTDRATSLALAARGRIVVAGVSNALSPDDFAVARYKPNGTLDPKFSNDGRKIIPGTGSNPGVTVIGGERIALAGSGNGDWILSVLRNSGKPDKDFSGVGVQIYNPGGNADSAGAIQRVDGGLAVAGETNKSGSRRFGIAVFKNNGALDGGFGNDGLKSFTVEQGASTEGARDLAVEGGDRIIAVGFTFDGSSGDQVLVKLKR